MPDKYEVGFNGSEISLPDIARDYFETVSAINAQIKNLTELKKSIENPLKKAMLKHGIKKFSNDIFTATATIGVTRRVINEEAMKADGIYDKYLMDMPVADNVRITYRVKEDE